MNAKFFDHEGKEFVSLSGGFMAKEEVVREATEDDRRRYHDAYQAFKNPPLAEETAVAPADPNAKASA